MTEPISQEGTPPPPADTPPTAADRTHPGPFHGIVAAVDEFLSHRIATKVSELARLYRYFDPDREELTPCQGHAEALRRLTETALPFFQRAGFRQLSWEEIHASSEIATPQGINLLVQPDLYEAVMVMVLPKATTYKTHRPWWRLFFKRKDLVEVYPRVILLVKPDPQRFKEPDLDTDHVFLRLFRNVPVHDLEMIFPGGKVKLTWLDQVMIYYPIIAGLGLLLYQWIPELMQKPIPHLLTQAFLAVGFYALLKWVVMVALGGWSWRTYSAYRGKMERYGLKLSRNLYLQTMDSNLGVFSRLAIDITQREREFLLRLSRLIGTKGFLHLGETEFLEASRKVATEAFPGEESFFDSLAKEFFELRKRFSHSTV